MNTLSIGLYDIKFNRCLGLLTQEKRVSQEFRLTVEVIIPASPAEQSPRSLDASISYAEMYEIVETEFNREAELLETIAIEMAKSLQQRWPEIEKGRIEIIKENPPIPGITGNAGIKYFFEKKR